jgi:transcription elongation factor Elf1
MTQPSPEPTPIRELPDAWAGRYCPACGEAALKVVHLPEIPDYLICSKCEISFEVDVTGQMLHIKVVPDRYEAADAVLYRKWIEARSLRGIIEKSKRASMPVQEFVAPPPKSMTNQEVWERAQGMYRLGNPPKKIELFLLQAGATPQQAAGALRALKKRAEQETKKQRSRVLLVAGVSTFLVMVAFAGWLLFSGQYAILFGLATPTPAPVGINAGDILKLIPSGVRPELPDTTVRMGGVASASCPKTQAGAVSTFGGVASLWKVDGQFMSWQMVSIEDSHTIRVPPNMSAGYVDNENFQFSQVYGPAIIYNVNFVAIVCP